VLPDDSTGQSPSTRHLAGQKAITVQGGYGVVFAIQVQILLSITRVAVQVILRMGNYPGIVILLTVVAWSGFVKHYDSV
jgi:hypothetical protein